VPPHTRSVETCGVLDRRGEELAEVEGARRYEVELAAGSEGDALARAIDHRDRVEHGHDGVDGIWREAGPAVHLGRCCRRVRVEMSDEAGVDREP
jgi:hypothetical protein